MWSSLGKVLSFLVLVATAVSADDCGDGWTYNSATQSCYYVNSTAQMTWHEALQWCTTMNSDLVSIANASEESFLVNHRYGLGKVWIGLHNRDTQHPGTYVWTDQSKYAYKHWPIGGPSTDVAEACVAIGADGYWDATACSQQLGFACKRLSSEPLPTFDNSSTFNFTTTSKCKGWYENGGYCYQYFSYRVHWEAARSRCFKQGAILIDILSAAELKFVDAFGRFKHVRSFWMSLNSRLNYSVFVWDDGTISGHALSTAPANLNWGRGEPNNNFGQEHCTETQGYPTLKWNDLRCSAYRAYICKRRINATYHDITPAKPTICPSGYKVFHHPTNGAVYCYTRHGTSYRYRKAWANAKRACQDAGQDLVSIGDQAENNFIHDNVMPHSSYRYYYFSTNTWIGFADPGLSGHYKWTDGHPVSYTHWSTGEPSRYTRRGCAYIYHYSTKWISDYCSTRRAYICKITLIKPKVSGPKPALKKFCSSGWRLHAGFCYHVGKDVVKDQATAASQCKQVGAKLASIHSFGEQAFVSSLLALENPKQDAYIGLSDIQTEGEYVWSDGSQMDYSYWASRQPNDHHNQDCTKIYRHRGTWNDVLCNTSLSYICKKPADQTSKPSQSPDSKCQSGWSQFDNKCFKVFNGSQSFAMADQKCSAFSNKNGLHGSLAAVVNRADNFFLASLVAESEAGKYHFAYWIGLNDRQTEGSYAWTSKQPITFVNWAYGQPNDNPDNGTSVASEDCVTFDSTTSQWTDRLCSRTFPYICMVPDADQTVKPTPTKPPLPPAGSQCAPGWIPYQDLCYGFFGTITTATVTMKSPVITPQTWDDAKLVCSQRGADFVSVHNQATQDFLADAFNITLKSGVMAYWIGLSALRVQKGGYYWSDGSPVDYTHWAVHEPNDRGGSEDCTEVLMTKRKAYSRRWNDKSCTARRAFVCTIARGKPLKTPPVEPTKAAPADLTKIDCAKGWLSTDGSCYKISESRRTWTAAQRKCSALSKQHGMPAGAQISLASIHNAQDHIRVVQALMAASKKMENVTNFWIGLSDRANESNFEWTDGSAIDYLPWSIGEPNDYGHHQDCVQIKGAYGYLFNDASCSQQFYYVCGHSRFVSQGATPSCPPSTSCRTKCPQGWQQFSGSCYIKIPVKMDYSEAIENCSLYSESVEEGDLVTINSREEERWLTQHLFTEENYYWIGLNDEDLENHWRWTSGVPVLYTNWDPSQPNNYRSNEDCAAADGKTNGLWFDRPCDSFYQFVCEMPAKPVTEPISTPAPTTQTSTGTGNGGTTSKQKGGKGGLSAVATALIGVLVTLIVVAILLGVAYLIYRRGQKIRSGLAGTVGFQRLNGDDDEDDDNLLVE